ncbi:glycoside hydrolase family 35 protein [Actinocatenispora rupis]|uniref:Beta-galactosidase n=1 Tax=Actinocatenispora rupis TaxID=519421 RepID=A0A8J3NG75_9ACTN|nr:beta-galactosidase family protein [Actinocatenispora rupis]GID16102.1 beta-galactosidase [Actinocatenispora rupis]
MPEFRVTPTGFTLDGAPHRVLSGAAHYFRTHPAQWADRLAMLRAMGLTCVETYVAWNVHEPRPGEYRMDGGADLGRFLDLAAEAGLHAIVRPGPYICAEWENGGLPAWLGTRLRCADPSYLSLVDRWFDVLLPVIVERQVTRGGNVLMVQVENEYGSYGDDADYLAHLADGLRRRGVDVPLFTSDGGTEFMLTGGSVPGVLSTVNFGSRARAEFAVAQRFRPDEPRMCMEYWNGWFDHWGEEHVTRDATDAAQVLDDILAAGASVNLYMAHGGTNFGCWAGANRGEPYASGRYQPTVTSYDYDAPMDERGAPTEKYHRFREVLARYSDSPPPEPPTMPDLLAPQRIPLGERTPLRALAAAATVRRAYPPGFAELGVTHGVVRYRTRVPGPRPELPLIVDGLADRAHAFVDGTPAGILDRDGTVELPLAVPAGGAEVELLVESMGRVNYGPALGEDKGVAAVRHHQQYLFGWTAEAFPLDGTPAVPWGTAAHDTPGPAYHRGTLTVDEPRDAYLAVPGGGKGYVWVNGFGLGRYWDRGPQHTLYLPAPVLRAGPNEVVVLELDATDPGPVEIRDTPELAGTRTSGVVTTP